LIDAAVAPCSSKLTSPACRAIRSRHPLRARVRAVVQAQRADQRGRQRFYEYALGDLRAGQDENTVASVLVITIIPRDSRLAECLTHRTVQALADGYLIPVRAAPISEPLNVDRNDGSVNGHAPILHLPSPARARQSHALANRELIPDPVARPLLETSP
jgi:hypothetical protein